MGLLKQYKQSIKMVEVEEPFDLYFHRIVSFMFVKLILPLPITPNQISLAALFMGIISGVLFSRGTEQGNFQAAIFYGLYYLLDLSDGQVARLKKNGTPLGRIIDGIADYVTHLAIFTGLAIATWGATHSMAQLGLVLATLASLLVHVVLFDYYRNRYLEYALGEVSLYGDDLAEMTLEHQRMSNEGGQWVSRLVLSIYLKYLKLQQAILPEKDGDNTAKAFETESFLEHNRLAIRLWSFMGSSLHITLLMVMALLNQISWYYYAVIGAINAYAVLMLAMQVVVDRKTIKNT